MPHHHVSTPLCTTPYHTVPHLATLCHTASNHKTSQHTSPSTHPRAPTHVDPHIALALRGVLSLLKICTDTHRPRFFVVESRWGNATWCDGQLRTVPVKHAAWGIQLRLPTAADAKEAPGRFAVLIVVYLIKPPISTRQTASATCQCEDMRSWQPR